ncbi:MAG: hypothetical protein Q7R65_01245 [bacterium]|nr:hypothetical protein [bacterium]
MLSNKIISVGIIIVILLVAVYVGNQVVRTTPQSGALGNYQYKVINSVEKCANAAPCMEGLLNDTAKDGWEFLNQDLGYMIFRK